MWLLLPIAAHAEPRAGQPVILSAEFSEPTRRYQHGVFGDDVTFGTLTIIYNTCYRCFAYTVNTLNIILPESRVFEDLAPRLADLNGDATPEVVVVETDSQQGARLSVYSIDGLVAATPFIGRTHRWLAPAGIADFNGDGQLDVAYIETPHLGKTLRIWSLRDGTLVQLAARSGLSNHRFGQGFISGGVRDCGQGAEIITADGAWQNIVASRMENGEIISEALGQFTDQDSFSAALACR
ncbi:MAG: VCBS repeat-containing protein [Rhodobacteraceae bacterium]|nr:VCBS repeat-containing protein [Paracoccaceae bacterium]